MNYACFGKTMENVRKRASIEIITSDEQRQKTVEKYYFRLEIIFSENFSVARMTKSKIYLDKTIYIGFAVLDSSKLLRYECHYEYMTWNQNMMKTLADFIWIRIDLFMIFELRIFMKSLKLTSKNSSMLQIIRKITLITSLLPIKKR